MALVTFREQQSLRASASARECRMDEASDRHAAEKPRLRIGVFLESLPDTGGGFQQALSTIESLTGRRATAHEFVVFTAFEESRQWLLKHGIEAIRFRHRPFNLLDRWSATVLGNAVMRRLRRLGFRSLGRRVDALLDEHGIDVALLNEMGDVAWCIGDHPFIVTVWDLDHRDHPEFPEAYADRVFERRERYLRVTLTRAMAVIANSPSAAGRIANLYQVDRNRIVELPFLPSVAVRRHAAGRGTMTVEEVRRKYDLPDDYVFYPAYFCFSKNHLYLLEGLIELERRHGIVLQAVFCGGGDPGEQERVERQAQALGLIERTRFLGVVPDEDVPALYQGAIALVMPTYSGPTNLPPLEAVTLGCPVIYSDLAGCREQMGDAALYCDLTDPSSLADHLANLIQDPSLLNRIRIAGRRHAAEIAKIDYGERLSRVLDDYAYVRRRWAWPQGLNERTAPAAGRRTSVLRLWRSSPAAGARPAIAGTRRLRDWRGRMGSLLRVGAIFLRDTFRHFTFPFSHFRGVYQSFPQARTAGSRSRRIGYDHADLARRYAAELCLSLDNSEYPVLYHLDRIVTDNCTVLDFGGNVGVHYLRYRQRLNLGNISWIVCDLPEITKVGRKLCADISNVTFVNDLEEIHASAIDIFLASDSLQYVESNDLLLPRLIDRGVRPRHVLIDQLPLYDGPRFVTLQNGGPVRYPQYVFNRQTYLKSIVGLGYELVDSWDCRNFSCIVPFHPERSVRSYSGLYFQASRESLLRTKAGSR